MGSRFSVENAALNYSVTERIDAGQYKMTCEETGIVGNQLFGRLIPIDTISGLGYAELADVLIPGEDVEADESLYWRYVESVSSTPYGGNIADYKKKVKAMEGVYDCKVFPVRRGGGTVDITLITTEFGPPSGTLIETVQEALDPVPYHQQGRGLAPVGHWVEVEGAKAVTVSLSTALVLRPDTGLEQVRTEIEEAFAGYLLEMRKGWADDENIVVRISQIEARILDIYGIVDISATYLNGKAANLTLTEEEIPMPGVCDLWLI